MLASKGFLTNPLTSTSLTHRPIICASNATHVACHTFSIIPYIVSQHMLFSFLNVLSHGTRLTLDGTDVCWVVQVRKLFQQLFSFVNVQLFNQLLLRRECCSFSNGEYVKTGLAEVENWIHSAGKDWTGESWDELRYIRQVCWHCTEALCVFCAG